VAVQVEDLNLVRDSFEDARRVYCTAIGDR
jgi:hypothetical protein